MRPLGIVLLIALSTTAVGCGPRRDRHEESFEKFCALYMQGFSALELSSGSQQVSYDTLVDRDSDPARFVLIISLSPPELTMTIVFRPKDHQWEMVAVPEITPPDPIGTISERHMGIYTNSWLAYKLALIRTSEPGWMDTVPTANDPGGS